MQKNLHSDQTGGGSHQPSGSNSNEEPKEFLDYPGQKESENPEHIISAHHKIDQNVCNPEIIPEDDIFAMISNGSFRGILSFDNGHNAMIQAK